jgi:hypothetical protein
MRLAAFALLAWFVVVTPAGAQDGASQPAGAGGDAVDLTPLFDVGTTEWMVTGGPAFGVVVFHSAGGHRYALQTISWGRILARPRGSGALRGRFEWAFEAVPVYGQFAPTNTYGVGFTPLVWRWNFEPRNHLAPYAELAGGALFTRDPVPARTTTANFTAHAGFGVRLFLRPQQALVLGYRFHHISNGNRLDRNPGVNAHVAQVGWTLLRPGK